MDLKRASTSETGILRSERGHRSFELYHRVFGSEFLLLYHYLLLCHDLPPLGQASAPLRSICSGTSRGCCHESPLAFSGPSHLGSASFPLAFRVDNSLNDPPRYLLGVPGRCHGRSIRHALIIVLLDGFTYRESRGAGWIATKSPSQGYLSLSSHVYRGVRRTAAAAGCKLHSR